MNYEKIYNSFIEDRLLKQSKIIGYSEKHHIVPKSLGGTDDNHNIINLCPSDHYFAHSLLAKIHGGPMYFALMLMSQDESSSARGYKPSRLKYDQVKKKMAAEKKRVMTGKGNHFYGKRHSSVSIAKISANRTGKCVGICHPSFGKPSKLIGRKLSEETKKKIARTKTGSKNPMHGISGAASPSYKQQIFVFRNRNTKQVFRGTQGEFIKEFNLCFKNVSAVILGKRKTCKDWQLMECLL